MYQLVHEIQSPDTLKYMGVLVKPSRFVYRSYRTLKRDFFPTKRLVSRIYQFEMFI